MPLDRFYMFFVTRSISRLEIYRTTANIEVPVFVEMIGFPMFGLVDPPRKLVCMNSNGNSLDHHGIPTIFKDGRHHLIYENRVFRLIVV